MPNDVIITPSTGRVQFVKDTGQALLRYNIDLSAASGLIIDSPLTSSVGIKSPNLVDLSGSNTFAGATTFNGATTINGNLSVYGATNIFSASNIYITSSILTVTDNILTLNALSPYQRYAGIEMYDTGSGTVSSILWDGTNDYFFLTGSGVNGKLITGPDGQTNLTSNYIPKATAGFKLGNSLVYDDGTYVGINTTAPSSSLTVQSNATQLRLQASSAPGSFFANVGARYDSTRPFTIEVANNNSTAAEFFGIYADSGGGNNRIALLNGNVGIGLTNPSAKFHITSSTNADEVLIGTIGNDQIVGGRTGGSFGISTKSTSNGNLILTSGDAFYIRTSGSNDRVIVKNDGNFGIGTTNPTSKLHIVTTGTNDGIILDGTSNPIFVHRTSGSDRTYLATTTNAGAFFTDAGQYDFIIRSQTNNILLGRGSGASTMAIVGNNVGIGTTLPSASLHIKSSTSGATLLRTDGTNGTLFSVVDDLSDSLMSVNNSAGLPVLEVFADDRIVAGQYGQNDLVVINNKVGIGTNNPIGKLHVTGSVTTPAAVLLGDVGIGTTAPTNQTNYRFLQVNGPVSAIIETMVGGSRIGGFDSTANTLYVGTIGSYPIVFRTAVDEKMRISANGNVGIGTASPTTPLHVVGVISGSSFTGAGTGLTGTATSLTVGNATSASYALVAATANNVNNGQLSFASGSGITISAGTFTANQSGNTAFTISLSSNSVTVGSTAIALGGTATTIAGLSSLTSTNLTASNISASATGSFGMVGIGTTSPASKLDVSGSISIRGTAVLQPAADIFPSGLGYDIYGNIRVLRSTSAQADGMYIGYGGGGGNLRFFSNSGTTEFMTIATSGYVGVGTTNPSYKLHVNGGPTEVANQVAGWFEKQSSTDGRIAHFTNSTGSGYSSYIYIGSNPGRDWKIGKNVLNSGTTGHFQITNDLSQLKMQINAADDSIIFPSASIGIGTTNPTQQLEVAGYSMAGIGAYRTSIYGNNGGSYLYFGTTSSLASLGSIGAYGALFNINSLNNDISFQYSGAEKMRITTGGHLGLGITDPTAYVNSNGNWFRPSLNGLYSSIYATTEAVVNLISSGSADGAAVGGVYFTRARAQGDAHFQIAAIRAIQAGTSNTIAGGALQFFTKTNGGGTPVASPQMVIWNDGNVGIGTSTPSSKLHISGSGQTILRIDSDTTTNIAQVQVKANGDGVLIAGMYGTASAGNNFGVTAASQAYIGTTTLNSGYPSSLVIGNVSSIPIAFSTNNTERMRIDGSGNLGIGTTSPAALLNIRASAPTTTGTVPTGTNVLIDSNTSNYLTFRNTGDNGTYAGLIFLDNNIGGYITFRNYTGDGVLAGSDCMIYGSFQDHVFQNGYVNENLYNRTETMRIKASGNVGIGTNSPAQKLDVAGNIRCVPASSAWAEGLSFSMPTASQWGGLRWRREIANADGNHYIGYTGLDSTDDLVFGSNNAGTQINNNIRITKAGLIGIGTSSPAYKLHVNGTSYATTLTDGSVSINNGDLLFAADGGGNGFQFDYYNGQMYIGDNAGSTWYMVIKDNGNVGIGTSSPVAKLHVTGDISSSAQVRAASFYTIGAAGSSYFENLNIGTGIYIEGGANEGIYFGDSNRWIIDTCNAAHNDNADGELHFRDYTNSITRMLIQYSTGNIGMGITTPSASLHVKSTTSGATLLRTDGTNGTLFSVVDDLSDSLMSVNNSAGLPVFEVFADDRIVAGQYGQNDFVVRNNYVGIGTNNPTAKLYVTSSTSTPSAVFLGGNVGIGSSSPSAKLVVNGEMQIQSSNAYITHFNHQDAGNNFITTANGGTTYFRGSSNNVTTMTVGGGGNVTLQRDLIVNGGIGNPYGNRIIVQGTATTYTLQDSTLRPTVYLNGDYPVVTLNCSATTNAAHGPTLQFAFNGLTTGGSTSRQIVIGANGAGGWLDFGFSGGGYGDNTSYNPHNGISGYNGITAMRLFSNGLLVGSTGTYPNHITSISNQLDVRGTGYFSGAVTASVFTGAGTGLTGTAASLTAGTATNATQFGGESNTNFMRGLGAGASASIDTYIDNGFRTVSYPGHTKGMLSFTMGGSIGTVQHEYFYNTPANGWRVRNRTDGATWSAWGNVVMTDGNQGLLTGVVITSNYSGTVSGLSIGGNAATATTATSAATWTTGRAFTIGSTAKTVDGSSAITWSLAEIGAAATNQTMYIGTTAVAINRASANLALTGITSIDGNAATATTATTATTANALNASNQYSVTGITGSIQTTAVRETFAAISSATTGAIDLSTGTVFNLAFTSTISVFSISNVNTSKVNSFTLISTPNGTSATITWNFITNGGASTAVKWAGTAPTATTTNGRFDVFSFVYDGTRWFGFTGGLNYN